MTFGPEIYNKNSLPHESNTGQEVIVSFNGTSVYGFLESVNGGMYVLKPCLVNQPSHGGEFSLKLMDRPASFPVQGSVVLPIDMESIDTLLENQERELKKEKTIEDGDENGC